MKIPEFVKKIGIIEGECRVYIEDYVYTHLNELRQKVDILPLRAALFGHVLKKEGKCFYFVYGAACVIDELEYGRDEEQVRKDFFEEYELIGYVNVRKDKQLMPEKSKGYYVFYETNEAMQNYLVFCYERENKKTQGKRDGAEVHRKKHRYSVYRLGMKMPGEALRRFFYGSLLLLLAIAVTSINDYEKMYGFVEMAGRAASFTQSAYFYTKELETGIWQIYGII